jgi:hypothetical protein
MVLYLCIYIAPLVELLFRDALEVDGILLSGWNFIIYKIKQTMCVSCYQT